MDADQSRWARRVQRRAVVMSTPSRLATTVTDMSAARAASTASRVPLLRMPWSRRCLPIVPGLAGRPLRELPEVDLALDVPRAPSQTGERSLGPQMFAGGSAPSWQSPAIQPADFSVVYSADSGKRPALALARKCYGFETDHG